MTKHATLLIAAVAAVAGACASTTEPMACIGNPKCKADLQPAMPTALGIAPADAEPVRFSCFAVQRSLLGDTLSVPIEAGDCSSPR